jgi:hypothetical protein
MAAEKYFVKLLKYAAIGVAVVPLSIVTHELGHFLFYHLFGADNVQLHSVSVSADKDALGNVQKAIVNIVGPIISYLTIALAFFLTRKRYVAFWVILALAAPLGRIVNFVYLYFRALGYSPNPNFDEFNFSRNLNIEPLWLSILTAFIVLATMFVFFKKSWKEGRFKELIAVIVSLVCGVLVWMLIGGLILP